MKIVIANSIGIDKNGFYIIHSPSRWSEGVKNPANWFAYYPWELAYLSAMLKAKTGHQIKFLDGCLEKLDRKAYYQRIAGESPDVLIMESATRMIDENLALALAIKNNFRTQLIFVGQHATAFPEKLRESGVDHVCLGEYEETVLDILLGKRQEDILGLYPNKRRPLLDVNSLPFPEDEDVRRIDYGMPGEPSSEYLEVQMYASRGCPGACNFCVARNVYYAAANWRPRKTSKIIEEISFLKNKYPQMQGVFFDEEVHNANRDFIQELTREISKAGLDQLRFEAMCDIRFLDDETLRMMKNAGYYKIRVGIESASAKVMDKISKNIGRERVHEGLKLIKKNGLKAYGTFTFGALGAEKKDDAMTIELIRELIRERLLDNLQVSICTPQPGTPFYDQVKEQLFSSKRISNACFDGANFSFLNYPGYSGKQIAKMKDLAMKTRDHEFLRQKIADKTFASWAIAIYERYGLMKTVSKGLARVCSEAGYQVNKWRK